MYHAAKNKCSDVHPDEVNNWAMLGWAKAENAKSVDPDEYGATDFSDAQLRDIIKQSTGKAPGARSSRATLVKKYNGLVNDSDG